MNPEIPPTFLEPAPRVATTRIRSRNGPFAGQWLASLRTPERLKVHTMEDLKGFHRDRPADAKTTLNSKYRS